MPLNTPKNPLLPRLPESAEDQERFNKDLLNYLERQNRNVVSDLESTSKTSITIHSSVSGSYSIDFDEGVHVITLSGSTTLSFDGLSSIDVGSIVIILDHGTGGDEVIWGNTIRWEESTEPDQSTDADSVDVFTVIYDGTNLYGFVGGFAFGEEV